jgi:hypothetical protein
MIHVIFGVKRSFFSGAEKRENGKSSDNAKAYTLKTCHLRRVVAPAWISGLIELNLPIKSFNKRSSGKTVKT